MLKILILTVAVVPISETEWCEQLAPKYNGVTEHILPDESRVDILSDTVAWEVDWAPKWPEAIGQSILYSIWTGRGPGVILLIKDKRKEKHFILRAKMVCQHLSIRLEVEDAY